MANDNSNIQLKILFSDLIKTRVNYKECIQDVVHYSNSQVELNEFAALVRSKITQMDQLMEELNKFYEEESNLAVRKNLKQEVENWAKIIQDDRQTFRNSMLTAQLRLSQSMREELFSPPEASETTDVGVRRRQKVTRELMLKKSSQLTDDLLSVTKMIRDGTEKSTKTLDTLVDSSQMVTSAQEELKTMGSVIGQAKKILSKYGRRENTDKLLISLGLIFFLASCLVVIRNRLTFIF